MNELSNKFFSSKIKIKFNLIKNTRSLILMESTKFCLELRKRKEKAYLEFTAEELKENPEKILNIMKKEFIHLKSWFIVIVSKYLFIINILFIKFHNKKISFSPNKHSK